MFKKAVVREKQVELLESLEVFGAKYERANSRNISIDIEPTGDHLAVFDQLDKYELDGYLSFETCEARVEGSFDDFPEEKNG
jgi:hypothetical protein